VTPVPEPECMRASARAVTVTAVTEMTTPSYYW
jgi:hypothetical protein